MKNTIYLVVAAASALYLSGCTQRQGYQQLKPGNCECKQKTIESAVIESSKPSLEALSANHPVRWTDEWCERNYR